MAIKYKVKLTTSNLVCPHIHTKYNDSGCWQFLDPILIKVIKKIRDKYLKTYSIIVNDWSTGGNRTSSGLVCNVCNEVMSASKSNKVYANTHSIGRAIDFIVIDSAGNEVPPLKVFELLKLAAESDQYNDLKFLIYLPSDKSYIHLDTSPSVPNWLWSDRVSDEIINNIKFTTDE